MKLYDMFFSTLENTDNIEKAIKTVETEILKRKTSLKNTTDSYCDLKTKLEKLLLLTKKYKMLVLSETK